MTDNTPTTPREYEYKAEMKQLLHLIVHSLYTHPEIFLRELISNASDALNKARFLQLSDRPALDADAKLAIRIDIDDKSRSFSIEDTGIGMTRDDLVERVGTVASSGTLDFLEKMKAENAQLDGELIGRFGVGFYSVFMVADEVTIETRHANPESTGYRWSSRGEGTFTIEEIDRPRRGTRISFTLKEDAKEFAEEHRLKGIVRKYSNFVNFPIFIGEEQINTVSALWHRSKDEITDEEAAEFYKFIANDFEAPLGRLHLSIEGRINFKALLFVPGAAPAYPFDLHREKTLHLYSNKVFIQDDCRELLPDYLGFLKGVVDTEDLPLNVSREVTQSSPVTAKIREVLTGRTLTMLEDWAKTEPDKFEKFQEQFGRYIALGAGSDFVNRERLMELLRFETTKTEKGKRASFKDYVAGMKEDQKEIYYLSGESREAAARNPNLEYFRKKDIEVIILTDPADVFTFPSLFEYDKKALTSIEKADIAIERGDDAERETVSGREAKSLLIMFKETLGKAIEDVAESRRLVDSVATLVVGKTGMDSRMEKMMKMMDHEYSGAKRILEINMAHPLVKNLARMNETHSDDELLKKCIRQVYEGALLMENNLTSPADFVQTMAEMMERATRGETGAS